MRRPDFRIGQDTFLTPFLCLIANVSMEDEKPLGTDMIKDRDLQSIITSALLIASADGSLNENDKKIIASYLNKYYKSGNIIWTKNSWRSNSQEDEFDKYYIMPRPFVDKGGQPYDILKAAVDTLNTSNKYAHNAFFQTLECLDISTRNEVVGLWYELAEGSQKRNDVLVALYRTVRW